MRSLNRCRRVKRGPPHLLRLCQCVCERTRFQDRWPRSNAADFVATPSPLLRCGREIDHLGGYHARAYTMELTNISHGSSVCMTEYLVAARAAIILWTSLAVMPAEIVFDVIEAELELHGVGLSRPRPETIGCAGCLVRHGYP